MGFFSLSLRNPFKYCTGLLADKIMSFIHILFVCIMPSCNMVRGISVGFNTTLYRDSIQKWSQRVLPKRLYFIARLHSVVTSVGSQLKLVGVLLQKIVYFS
jgi:hypothetical protein